MSDFTALFFSLIIVSLLIAHDVERRRNVELLKELAILQKSSTVNEFVKYEEKDIEIPEEDDDNDFSSYVSISDASPEELAGAKINLTPYTKK